MVLTQSFEFKTSPPALNKVAMSGFLRGCRLAASSFLVASAMDRPRRAPGPSTPLFAPPWLPAGVADFWAAGAPIGDLQ